MFSLKLFEIKNINFLFNKIILHIYVIYCMTRELKNTETFVKFIYPYFNAD